MPAVVYLSFAQLVKQASAAIALILKTVLFEKDNSGLFCYQREAFLQISSICSKLKERFSLAVGSQLRRDPHNFSALELQASQSIPKTMTNHICLFSFLHTHRFSQVSASSPRMGQTCFVTLQLWLYFPTHFSRDISRGRTPKQSLVFWL